MRPVAAAQMLAGHECHTARWLEKLAANCSRAEASVPVAEPMTVGNDGGMRSVSSHLFEIDNRFPFQAMLTWGGFGVAVTSSFDGLAIKSAATRGCVR